MAKREGAFQPLEGGGSGLGGAGPQAAVEGDQVRHDFRIGFAFEEVAGGQQFIAQDLVVFDNAIVHHRHHIGRVGVGVQLGRAAMRRPAGVADADIAAERLRIEAERQVVQLPRSPPPLDLPIDQRGDAGAVIAAIFKPPQALHNGSRHVVAADDADDAAHGLIPN